MPDSIGKLNIAVIGCGHWGPNHVRIFNFFPQSDVVMAIDSDVEKVNSIKKLYPHITCESDYRNALSNDNVDAVVVSTPTSTHYPIVSDALRAGKHVLCEKPLCTTVKETEDLGRLAEDNNLTLAVGYVFLFNNGIIKLKELIQNGDLGSLYYMSIARTNLGPIRTDVNVVYDLITHDISILNFLLESRPDSVSAVGGAFLNRNVEDVAFVTLAYPDGLVVNLRASWLDPHKVRQITVVGDKTMALWDDLEPLGAIKIYNKGVVQPPSYTDFAEYIHLREGDITIPKIPFSEPLKNQNQHFLSNITQKEKPVNDANFEIDVIRVIESVNKSITTGNTIRIE
jgi:predicted dehydrogenase